MDLMNDTCEIVRDLLPLYVDDVCSPASRAMVAEHVQTCGACASLLQKLRCDEVETDLRGEREDVILRQAQRFRRRSTTAGMTVAGILAVPILVCLIVNLAAGSGLSWFFVVLAAMAVTASVTVVPLLAPSHKFLWTVAAFTASLLVLLGVCALYTGGGWFLTVSLSTLFGLSVVLLPFVVRQEPICSALHGQKALVVFAVDTALLCAMLAAIGGWELLRLGLICGLPALVLAWAAMAVLRYLPGNGWIKAALCAVLTGVCGFFAQWIVGGLLGAPVALPAFSPLVWTWKTVNANLCWLWLLGCLMLALLFLILGIAAGLRGRKER